MKNEDEVKKGLFFNFFKCFGQASVLKKYPAKLSLTSYTCFFGLVQFLAIAAYAETDYEHWKIASKEEVFAILYAVTNLAF